jgi:hypothetical protein|tara:strand:- start:18 stop:938 length:921 start_codon:yes stop_codon:yes gene_type:complete
MTKQSIETALYLIFYTIAFIYIVACAFDTIENLSILGASMITFKPGFPSIIDMVREDRRYGESDRMRNYAGLHTPAYRVLNHVSKALLKAGLYGACTVMNSRSQYKHISYKSLFSVTIAYGYSAVTIGACRIFAVDEWTRTIYHVDSNGMMNVTPYHQGYDMSDVIAQVSECIEVLKECYIAPAAEPVQETRWAVKRVIKDRPYHGPIKGATWSVRATLLASSKKLVHWKVEWYDMDNPSRTRIESGVWAKAYKVEIDGVVAWLPHSLLGEIYSSPWAGSRVARPTATIDVPEWWYQKSILVAYPA